MRKHTFIVGSYFHIYNRGVDKRDIFVDAKDSNRFLLCMELFCYETPVRSIQLALRGENVDVGHLQRGRKIVSVVEYCLNPNHFHFILREEIDGGISEFMKRLLGGYTHYFNIKYNRSGALFQGRFKSSYAEKEGYFERLFTYVMWNYKVHDIPKDKLHLIRTSEQEYKTGVFSVIDEREGKKFLDWFGGYVTFLNHSKEMMAMIRRERGKQTNFDFDDD